MHSMKSKRQYFTNKISALKISGFLVIYNSLSIERLVKDNKININWKIIKNYAILPTKDGNIHIVGEYAKKMMKNHKCINFCR